MAIDGLSGAYDDDPEQGKDSKPEKEHKRGRPDVGGSADNQPAEIRSRTEYYEALRAIDQRMATADKAGAAPDTPGATRMGR